MVKYVPNNVEVLLREVCKELADKDAKITALENRVTVLENNFTGAVTDSAHFVSSDGTTYTGKSISIVNGIIKTIS
jgi:hypothetical protein